MRPLICLSLMLSFAQLSLAQRFELVEPSGRVAAVAEASRGRLLVHEATGEQIHFSREARYDSADRDFVGYFSFELNRVLRFPRSGRGVMQTADLEDASPRFRNTVRVVRPLTQETGRGVIAAPTGPSLLIPPSVVNPYSASPYNHPYIDPYLDPYVAAYRGVVPLAQSVLIDSQTIPNPPLPVARVLMRNDGPREIQVGLVDLRNPAGNRSMRIQPATAAEVELVRDAGAKRIDHYRVVTPLGEWITKEIVTEIPPATRYEVVVHEWSMQSIAIDRTGKSPNPIEDINFQGRGIGRFILPPGPQLQSGQIDVYRAARSRGGAGTIAPILPRDDFPAGTGSPLERVIQDLQRAQRN